MLEKTVVYPDIPALCNAVTVLDHEGVAAYRIYQSFFSPQSIRSELEKNGFRVEAFLSSLCGESYTDESLEIGVVCRKVGE